jgi:hypothetical protein
MLLHVEGRLGGFDEADAPVSGYNVYSSISGMDAYDPSSAQDRRVRGIPGRASKPPRRTRKHTSPGFYIL